MQPGRSRVAPCASARLLLSPKGACAHEPPNRSLHGLELDPHCVEIRLGRIRDPELVQRVEQLDAIGA